MSNELYTIVVSGNRLVFSKDQILSDPGNYFETYFFGDFAEGAQGTRELLVQKDVQLFKLIQAHLRGYEILPLADAAIPSYMTKEVALANLLREAQFYCLQMLVDRIQLFLAHSTAQTPAKVIGTPRKYKFASGGTMYRYTWSTQDITEEIYQFYRQRLSTLQRIEFKALNESPDLDYSVEIAWVEFDDINKGGTGMYALLISHE